MGAIILWPLAYNEVIFLHKRDKIKTSFFLQNSKAQHSHAFYVGSQFSYLATPETQFQITIDKHVLYQNTNYFKGKELLIEDDEDAPPIKFFKARPRRLFKHELEALKQKIELTNLDWYATTSFYGLKEYYSGLESDEKPPVDVVHHKVRQHYETLNHSCFTQETVGQVTLIT